MDLTRYIVQPEGSKFVVYKEFLYDNGQHKLVFIDSFVKEARALGLAQDLMREDPDVSA